jgi:hypothetical protein
MQSVTVYQSPRHEGCWIVEAIDEDGRSFERAVFVGKGAEEYANAFARLRSDGGMGARLIIASQPEELAAA